MMLYDGPTYNGLHCPIQRRVRTLLVQVCQKQE